MKLFIQNTHGKIELSTKVVATFAFLPAILFVVLALQFDSALAKNFDTSVFNLFHDNGDPYGPPWLEEAARDVTALGSITVLAIITFSALGYILINGNRRRMAFVLMIATIAALLLSTSLKELFDRARPDLIENGVRVFSKSFPSAHAMHSAATYLTLGTIMALAHSKFWVRFYIFTVVLLLVFMVGVSRVYLGVHWPTDVIAGWSLGVVVAMLMVLLARWLLRLQYSST